MPTPLLSKQGFIDKLMKNKKMTKDELDKWLESNQLVIAPCHCDCDTCNGWGIYGVEETD